MTWPGVDTFVGRRIFWLLRPVWALGIRPRVLARVLFLVSFVAVVLGAVFGLLFGDLLALTFVAWAVLLGYGLLGAIPKWDRINDEIDRGVLSIELVLRLRGISEVRTCTLFSLVGSSLAAVTIIASDSNEWIGSLITPAILVLCLVALHATTVIGQPPRSIQRRAADRVKEMIAARPRLVLNPQLS